MAGNAGRDGSLVHFSNNTDSVVAGDSNNFATDLYLKNLRTGGVTCESTAATGATLSRDNATCLGLSPDGRFAVFSAVVGGSAP